MRRIFKNKLWLIGLIMVLLGGFFANLVQTQSGNIKVEEVTFAASDGSQLSALLYLPKNATEKTPAPAMITVHGYLNQKETQSNFSIEFARRGYAVLELDLSGHGSSEQIEGDMSRGVNDALNYVESLAFVDKDNIGLEGHSMGGWSVVTAAAENYEQLRTLVVIGSAQGNLELGNALGAPAIPEDAALNYAVIFSKYDEFVGINYFVKKAEDFVTASNLMEPFGTDEPVVLEQLYGDFEDGSARMAFMPNTSHVGEHQSHEVIADVMDFVNQSSPAPIQLDSSDQVWQYKEVSTAAAYIGLILFMFGLLSRLLQDVHFSSVVQTSTSRPAPRKPLVLGIVYALMIALCGFTFLPINSWATNKWLATWTPSNPFAQAFTGTTIFYLGILQLAALAMFLIWKFVFAKKETDGIFELGLSTNVSKKEFSFRYIAKAACLAILTVACTYLLLCVVHTLFLTDVRWWFFSIRTMNRARLGQFLLYFIPFLLIFGVNNFISFGWLRLKDFGSERKNIVVGSIAHFLVNALGIIIVIAIQLIGVRVNGYVPFASGTFDQLLIVLSYGFIPLLAIIAVFSTYCYNKTRNIYTGSFISALVATWLIVCYQPIGMPFYL